MKSILALLVVTLLALAGCQPSEPTAPNGYTLNIATTPAEAVVLIDGQSVGTSPVELHVGFKPHFVELRKDGYETQWVRVDGAQKTNLTIDKKLAQATAAVSIESQPVGASVKLDGANVGETPMVLPQVAVGTHTLRLGHAGYLDQQAEIRVENTRPMKVDYTMVSLLGEIRIISDPPGAEILLDNNPVGVTPEQPGEPLIITDVVEGNHALLARRPNYEDIFESIIVERKQSRTVNMTLHEKPGTIVIRTQPAGALVYNSKNEMIGETPLTIEKLSPGEYRYRIDRQGYSPTNTLVTVSAALTKYVDLNLDKEAATLLLTTEPAGCLVTLDGKKIGTTERGTGPGVSKALQIDDIKAGPHDLTVEHPEYESLTRRLTFAKGETANERVALQALFIARHRLMLKNGQSYDGILVRTLPDGSIEFQLKRGTTVFTSTYKKAEIKGVSNL